MTQVKPDQNVSPEAPAASSPDDAVDSLKGLHRMSTTAGVGAQDYVAINPMSVAAIVFGLATVIAFLSNVLLIIPVAGVVCGILAIRQINRSSGTQTGKALAWAGVILSVGLSAIIIGQQVVEAAITRGDEQEIAQVIDRFGQHAVDGELDQAYALFSARFAQSVPRSRFDQQMRTFQQHPLYGRLQSIEWNGRAVFDVDRTANLEVAAIMVIIQYEQAQAQFRHQLMLRKEAEQWLIDDFQALFPNDPEMGFF
jgi:hypothetical protein